jgi:diguanylate cyclase (GGDEF)-like protein
MTHQIVQERSTQDGSVAQGYIAAISRGLPSGDDTSQAHRTALAITAVLQRTLDASQLIELFAAELHKVIPHDSIAYRHAAHTIDVVKGKPARHSCTYNLMVEDEALGEISFTRGAPFSNEELTLLEYLLCSLVYPLRNVIDYKKVTDQAHRDPLTGVFNRGMLELVLRRETALAKRHDSPFSLLFIDIDRFKDINDRLGHATGDRAIRSFVESIERNMRTTDMLARYGGDEFVLILSNTPEKGATLVAERIRKAVEATICHDGDGNVIVLTASLGVAALRSGDSSESLLTRADQALQAAKQAGRNRVHV